MPELPKGVVTHMTVNNCAAAIEFYKKALGAKELMNMPEKDGKRVMHAELEINGGILYLNDDFPEYCGGKGRTPQALGGSPITLHLNVPNCDEAVKRAVAAGGKCTMEPIDAFWGARYGQVTDPFGYVWAFMHPLMKS
jgi:PhnB protein